MKKFLTALLALSLCGIMLTACGSDETTAEAETTASVSETAEEAEAEETEAEETEAEETEAEETEAEETEAEETEAASSSYGSLDEFVQSGDAFKLATTDVSAADSYIYEWIRIFEGADGIYMDVEATDGSMTMVAAMAQDKMSMKVYEATSDTALTILFIDNKMYMLDDATKSGYYMTGDESLMEDYDIKSMLGEIDFDAEAANATEVKVAAVEIGGEKCTFEIATETGGGFVFDKDKNLLAILSPETGSTLTALKVNEFSGEVSDELFEIPSDYQLIDMEAMLAE